MIPPLKNILVYRIGFLGDLVIALPCFHALKARHPGARITLLNETRGGSQYVAARDIFGESGLIDEVLTYRADAEHKLAEYWKLWREIRRRRFDLLVYLMPSERPLKSVRRDRLFFRSAGIRAIAGADRPERTLLRLAPRPLERLTCEADTLLGFLAKSGWDVPAAGQGCMDFVFSDKERAAVAAWTAKQPADGGRRWLGLGIGSKIPSKIWPIERYTEVVRRLVEHSDLWPVIFGGKEDVASGRDLLAAVGRGAMAAGELSIRESALALEQCALYIGNDSGALHMAAAGGVPCVAIIAARLYPGLWDPYGPGHIVFRQALDCEGCNLVVCAERRNECLTRIGADEVYNACLAQLERVQTPS